MKLDTNIKQLSTEIFKILEFDLIIVASGYETRASYISTKFKPKGKEKIAFTFNNYDNIENRLKNDKLFSSLGYNLINSEGDSETTITKLLESIAFTNQTEFNILVDYSSMTRVWYATILDYFRYFESEKELIVNLYFVYSKANFVPPPKKEVPNRHIGPLKGFYRMSFPDKPTVLIIGLGYEKIRAFGLTEFLDAETILFYTDLSNQNKFSIEVEKNNEEMLRIVSEENIFKYSIDKLEHLNYILNSLCKKLCEKYRIVIAPCGPKPFTLIALINSILLSDLDVWRISPGIQGIPIDRTASGEVYILKLPFMTQI
jgi:hypothetical protein